MNRQSNYVEDDGGDGSDDGITVDGDDGAANEDEAESDSF